MTTEKTSSREFFEAKYLQNADPWHFAESEYERSRYQAIVAALLPHRYHHAFEPGCSIGVLTEQLASICGVVTAIDFSAAALACARERCAYLTNVELRCAPLTALEIPQDCDLIVLSEIGYYFSRDQWAALSLQIANTLPNKATLLAAHWLGFSKDHRMHGDEVHEIIGNCHGLKLEFSERHPGFRLDRWTRR